MHRISRSQKEKVSQFRAITGAEERISLQCLQAANWVFEGAIDIFYSSQQQTPSRAVAQPSVSQAALDSLYKRYRSDDCNVIRAEGVGRFCEDLEVDPSDIVMLIISWHWGAATMCEYTKSEFMSGMRKLGCDSVDKLRRKLPTLRAELQDDAKFKEVYQYAYQFSRENGQKCVQLDVAMEMWRLLFSARPWPLAQAWAEYLTQHHQRAISKDTWMQLLDFSRAIKPDLSNFETDANMSAWPVLIDEFVEHMRANGTETPVGAK